MRKFFLAIIISTVLIIVTSCNSHDNTYMKMEKHNLTQEEKEILEIMSLEDLSNSFHIFDFEVDDKVNYVTINTYELNEEGEWQLLSGNGGQKLYDKCGRVALDFDVIGNGIKTIIQSDNSTNSNQYTSLVSINNEGISIANSFLDKDTTIVYEKEIPIIVQVISNKNGVSNYNVGHFFQPREYFKLDYEHIYAVTIMFSQNEIPLR